MILCLYPLLVLTRSRKSSGYVQGFVEQRLTASEKENKNHSVGTVLTLIPPRTTPGVKNPAWLHSIPAALREKGTSGEGSGLESSEDWWSRSLHRLDSAPATLQEHARLPCGTTNISRHMITDLGNLTFPFPNHDGPDSMFPQFLPSRAHSLQTSRRPLATYF